MGRGFRPESFHAAIAIALVLGITIGLMFLFRLQASISWPLLFCYLGAVNVVAFGYYGYDKARATKARTRVPEVVLHGLGLAGGSLGAYGGMRIFRHKTIKGSFRVVFWLIAVLQVLLVAAVLYRMWKERE